MDLIVRVPPFMYIHVLDSNTNVERVVCGPTTYTRPEHERIVDGPLKMLTIPPRSYCVVADPCCRTSENALEIGAYGLVKLRHGDLEIRTASTHPEPFPLYPGETLHQEVRTLRVIETNRALRLSVTRDYEDTSVTPPVFRRAGDEFLCRGPCTYVPRVEVAEGELIQAVVVKHSHALLLRAVRDTMDSKGNKRSAGEEWLHRDVGAYLPSIDEEILRTIQASTLTKERALHLRAKKTFLDEYGVKRRAGEEWLVTHEQTESHLCDVYEEIVGMVELTTLTSRQFCVILNPVDPATQTPRLGARELRRGERSFFLQPKEIMEKGVPQNVYVLAENEALLLQANEAFQELETDARLPGDRWLVRGPREFVPPTQVEVLELRRSIPLDTNEGVYVRNTQNGQVRAVLGTSYMLSAHEELWTKELPSEVEELLVRQSLGQTYVQSESAQREALSQALPRQKHKVVQFRVPSNAAVQVYDYQQKTSRVVVGPDLICLGADEQFTVVQLSGEVPKLPNRIKTLSLMLGPDFFRDVIELETADHARLRVVLAFNWHFEADRTDPAAMARCFAVRDFVGDACKALGSRIRGAVANESFDRFHKHSAKIIRSSVFGPQDDRLLFPANGLCITNVDVQSVEPIDASTRESLQKSVQLAIEITTNSQEASAHHVAHREEAAAQGLLERQKLSNEADAELARKKLLELKAESRAVEAAGSATAEAKAKQEALRIENESLVAQAKLRAEAHAVTRAAELQGLRERQAQELAHAEALASLELRKARELAKIESEKLTAALQAIGGGSTLAELARAGPETQAKLLGGLGLKSMLITDGRSPLNLFNTAEGLIATNSGVSSAS